MCSKTFYLVNLFILASAYIEIEIQSLKQQTDSTLFDYTALKIRKHEGSRKIFGNVTHNIELNNSYTFVTEMFVKQGGEYRKRPFRMPAAPLCDFYTSDVFFYEELTKYSTFPNPFVCPIKTGIYQFKGFTLSFRDLPLVFVSNGEYAFDVIYLKDEELIYKQRIYYSVINV